MTALPCALDEPPFRSVPIFEAIAIRLEATAVRLEAIAIAVYFVSARQCSLQSTRSSSRPPPLYGFKVEAECSGNTNLRSTRDVRHVSAPLQTYVYRK